MKFSRGRQEDVGDFSVSFGDMVFGLLFFFFVLSLAMIFNRPDMRDFVKEHDKLLKQDERQRQTIDRLQQELQALQALQAKARRKEAELIKDLAASKSQNKAQAAQIAKLAKDNAKLAQQAKALNKNVSTLTSALTAANKNTEVERKRVKQLATMMRKEQDKSAKLQSLFEAIKQTLKEQGYLELLADVEKTLQQKEGEVGKGDEQPPQDIAKLYVKFYGPDEMDMKTYTGDSQTSSAPGSRADEVVGAAKQLMDAYAQQSASYSEADKTKFSPRIYLMNNPEAAYGVVQEFMLKLRKIIPVSIQTWE